MNLETALPPSLWDAIRNNYEKRDFTSAILDCCYFISEILREKSGSNGDGVPLVGQALGGTSPKIRIAKDQSETEQNIQKGIENILRGFYQAIRNPRSHKKIVDNADDGISIILFCGYLVKQIEQARALASKEELIRRALDRDFVPNEKYAELLLSEIPTRLRLEVFFGVYERRTEWKVRPIYHFNKHKIAQMSSEDRVTIVDTISNDLKITDDDLTIRHVMSGMPAEIWSEIADIARLRIEHKVIGSIREGKYDRKAQNCLAVGLATWSKAQFSYFLLKKELISAIAIKLGSSDSQGRDYAFQYLTDEAFRSFGKDDLGPIHSVFTRKLKEGVEAFHDDLLFEADDKWSTEMKAAYQNFSAKADTLYQFPLISTHWPNRASRST